MNPNAKPFVFNPSAASWGSAPAVVSASLPSDELVDKSVNAAASVDGQVEEDSIDETDPLWIAALKIAEGDREKCLKLLEDPDALMAYPEVKAIMDSVDSVPPEEWESSESMVPSVSAPLPPLPPVESSEVIKKGTLNTPPPPNSSADEPDFEDDGAIVSEGDSREHINLVFIGHVDAGKSTLSGSILYLMGMVDKRTIERFEKEAKQRNRESWFLAFIMDTSEEERAKGITVEVGRAHFETEIHRYTILDAPGHKNYVPNMISGAAQADVGILVISARKGEFETGFEKGGQTREHALLAKTLGVRYLVVVINKMDDPTVCWAQSRYEECVNKLKPYLKACGFAIKKEVKFIPISGLNGDNVLNEVSSERCNWWREMYTTGQHNTTCPTLIGTLDAFSIAGRNPDGALRIPVLDRYFERGCNVMGKVESGSVRIGDEIVIAPTKRRAKVEAIYIKEEKVRSARPGENITLKFNMNVEDFQKGFVLCTPTNICRAVVEFKVLLALVELLEHRPIFCTGYEAVMHCHTTEIEVTCTELCCIIDEKTQAKIKRSFARQGQQCIARFTTPLSTCLEVFDDFPSLGRVTLRDEGRTIAIGKVVELVR